MKSRKILLTESLKTKLIIEDVNHKLEKDFVLVKIIRSGICGSDLHYFRHGGLGSFKSKMPMSLGHEASGIVLDSKSDKYDTDERVYIEPSRVCLNCFHCKNNKINLCKNVLFNGANSDGLLQDYIVVHSSQLSKLNSSLKFQQAAMIEPFGVALHNIELAKNVSNNNQFSSFLIVGAGTIGIMIMEILKKQHQNSIFKCVETNPYRRTKINNLYKDALDLENKKFDIVFDVAGNQDSITISEDKLTTGGTIVLIGIPEVDFLSINPHKLRINEGRVIFSRRCSLPHENVVKEFNGFNFEKILEVETFSPENNLKAFRTAEAYNKCHKVQLDFS